MLLSFIHFCSYREQTR